LIDFFKKLMFLCEPRVLHLHPSFASDGSFNSNVGFKKAFDLVGGTRFYLICISVHFNSRIILFTTKKKTPK
jgi:hypothetical protein